MKHTTVSAIVKRICPMIGRIALPVLSVVAFYVLFGCPIRFLTGISCPGCGMTRAYLSLLTGHIGRAYQYHPLFWLVPIGAVVYAGRRRLPERLVKILLVIGVVLFLGVYVYRLSDPTDMVVTADPARGFYAKLWRLIHWLIFDSI